jgi:phosphoadenosine phosphosulfate reductase
MLQQEISRSKTESALEMIQTALRHEGSPCITCSFQAEDMVVVDLVRRTVPDIPILFLETGYHFPEIYAFRDRMTARYGLNLINVIPQETVAQQEAKFGLLYQSQPDQCCKVRKVGPLFSALDNFALWFTGLRRAQSPTRANLKPVDTFPLPSGKQLHKVSPLADWSDKEVWTYAREHQIPLVSLYSDGYTSIGCQPCTARPFDAANTRSGRWGGRKLECGIHIAEGH